MLKLYIGDTTRIISTVLILLFCVFFVFVTARNSNITHWGTLVLIVLLLGLCMSIISGIKDGMGTTSQLITKGHWQMIVLSILGGLGFLVGIIAIFIRNQAFWEVSFYTLSSIIIIKIILTEGIRLVNYFNHS